MGIYKFERIDQSKLIIKNVYLLVDDVSSVVFSFNSKFLVIGSWDSSVNLIDIKSK